MKLAVRKWYCPVRGVLFSTILLGISCFSFSQPIDFKQTLNYLNGKFEGKCEFKDKKSHILISFYKDGNVYREDKIVPNDLEPDKVVYSAEEDAVIIPCKESAPGCVQRKIVHLKKIDQYPRLNLPMNGADEKSRKGVQEACIHLIKLSVYSDHVRTEPFE